MRWSKRTSRYWVGGVWQVCRGITAGPTVLALGELPSMVTLRPVGKRGTVHGTRIEVPIEEIPELVKELTRIKDEVDRQASGGHLERV